MKIYVITVGEYSSYSIVGVTLDKTKADAYVSLYRKENTWDIAQVEEYETDDFCRDGLYRYRVEKYYGDDFEVAPWNSDTDPGEWINGNGFGVIVFARDKDHALKAAFDKVAMLRAEREGIT